MLDFLNMNPLEKYLHWVKQKFNINNLERNIQIKEGEVYWCSLGLNVGDEENGKGAGYRRPILVLKKFNNNIFLGVPLSTKNKNNKYYTKVTLKDTVQSAMISQIRIIDTKRLSDKIGYIKKEDLASVKSNISKMIID